ncbi:NYN domain-containing protein [Roseinatronobacter monicus]|uniref:Uncharacterized LabA/DUF88 family protein n=1 Tax=Roseinatronobacter monicus TaxID=393481 RepID=A0A543K5X0_9RHOB|nr:NYN domain-containing protein [Roseinatronobacter monicus]TQM90477.1 uncharacterized LabA/DUF88 family protein [Roseinatronobacter monicus]
MTDPEDFEQIVLLIDGSHVDRLRSKLGRALDLIRLRKFFEGDGKTVSVIYYRDARDMDEYNRLTRFFDWLERHDIERRGAQDFSESWYQRERYGTNLAELAADAIIAAHKGAELVFVAGDAKLLPLFRRLEEMDVPVTLISTRAIPKSIAPPPPLIDLAEDFIDINGDARFFHTGD